MTKPAFQPNLIHQIMLGHMLDIKQTTRRETRPKKDKTIRYTNPETGESYPIQTWVDVPVDVPVPTLAGNISELNCERSARRWLF